MYNLYAKKICTKYAANMHCMHRCIFRIFLHIYAPPTLKMDSEPLAQVPVVIVFMAYRVKFKCGGPGPGIQVTETVRIQ